MKLHKARVDEFAQTWIKRKNNYLNYEPALNVNKLQAYASPVRITLPPQQVRQEE